MADLQWMKIQIDMFNNPKIKYIDSLEDNNLFHYIWMSSILLAGRCNMNGELYLCNDMPYTIKTLAIEFRRTVDEVKKAYKLFMKLDMIELTEEKVYWIKGWQEHQNVEGIEKIRKQTNERVSRYREKKREEKKKNSSPNNSSDENNKKLVNDSECDNANENSSAEKTNDTSNVTCNANDESIDSKNNVTETQENKKRNVRKKNKKRENNESSVSQSDNISSEVIELSTYCEDITGQVGVLDIGALKLQVNMHGKENVKKAINKAIELGKINMPYIGGILSNWRKEGYPKEDDVGGNEHGGKCNNKSNEPDTNKLTNFKPKEPRKLSEEERKRASASVI